MTSYPIPFQPEVTVALDDAGASIVAQFCCALAKRHKSIAETEPEYAWQMAAFTAGYMAHQEGFLKIRDTVEDLTSAGYIDLTDPSKSQIENRKSQIEARQWYIFNEFLQKVEDWLEAAYAHDPDNPNVTFNPKAFQSQSPPDPLRTRI